MGCSVFCRTGFTKPLSRCILLLAAGLLPAPMVAAAEKPIRFDRDIRPLLSEHCYACHGPGKQEAGLRLDDGEAATRVLDSGASAVVPPSAATK